MALSAVVGADTCAPAVFATTSTAIVGAFLLRWPRHVLLHRFTHYYVSPMLSGRHLRLWCSDCRRLVLLQRLHRAQVLPDTRSDSLALSKYLMCHTVGALAVFAAPKGPLLCILKTTHITYHRCCPAGIVAFGALTGPVLSHRQHRTQALPDTRSDSLALRCDVSTRAMLLSSVSKGF